jgi:tetratricopeptide (TPR) repeat protein
MSEGRSTPGDRFAVSGMPNWNRRLAVAAGGCLMAVGLAARLPATAAALVQNVALLRVVAAPACNPQWFVCAHTEWGLWYPPQLLPGNAETIASTLDGLRQAEVIEPGNRRAQLHEAEMLFALGEHEQAAAVLSEAGWPPGPEPLAASPDRPELSGSPLLTVGRYEHDLVRGYQWAAAGQWQAATQAFQFGLAQAGERALEKDRHAFYEASARWHASQAEASPEEQRLAGKYFALAGEWEMAVQSLEPLLAGRGGLTQVERAWAFYYLGRARAGAGDTMEAIEAYRAGWRAAPEVRVNGIELARLLAANEPAEAQAVQQALIAAGPAFPNGRSGPGYQLLKTAAIPSGLTFRGYDLDPESVEAGAVLEVWLWWQKPPRFSLIHQSGDEVMEFGDSLWQRQTVTNLIVNNTFEWGEWPSGVPLGWDDRLYTKSPDSFFIETAERDGRETHVAASANHGIDSAGLLGHDLPMQADGWYLMAGWMNSTGNGNLGRNCQGTVFGPGRPYYIAYSDETPVRPAGEWVHYADLAPAFPGGQPEVCALLLTDSNSPGSTSLWDDLILARVDLP